MISFMRNRILATVVAAYMIGLVASPAWAAMVPSQGSTGADGKAQIQEEIDTIQLALENKLVQEKLKDYGLTADEVRTKLSGMSPAQIHLLSQASGDVLAGGDGVGAVIGVLIIVILVIIILKLLNHDIIIKFSLENTDSPAHAHIG